MRIDLDTATNVIRSATAINAELLMLKGKLGTILPGDYADFLVIEGEIQLFDPALADRRLNLRREAIEPIDARNILETAGNAVCSLAPRGTRRERVGGEGFRV